MKTILMAVAAAIVFSTVVFAASGVPTTPEQKVRREEVRKYLKELNSLIDEAKAKNIETLRFEAIAMVSKVGLEQRWLQPFHEDYREQYCDFVEKNCKEGIEKLKGIMSGKIKQIPAPPWPDAADYTIKDGYIHSGDKVVIPYHYGFAMGPTKNYDFNRKFMGEVFAVGATRYDVVRAPIYEAFKKYPDVQRIWPKGFFAGHIIEDGGSDGAAICVICLESPHTREAALKYIQEKITPLANDPKIKVIMMGMEHQYVCFCDYTKTMFQAWLKEKYSKIDSLNSIWKTGFKDFSEIVLPPVEVSQETNDAKWYDFAVFNCYRLTEYFKWAKAEMKKIAPDKLYMMGSPFYAFSGTVGLAGLDTELMSNEVADVIMKESSPSTNQVDLLWSLSGGKKLVYDSEYHGDIAHAWAQLLHGCGFTYHWWWPSGGAQFLDSSIPDSYKIPLSDALTALNLTMDVRLVGNEVSEFPKAALSAKVALLYSNTSMLQVPPLQRNSRNIPYIREFNNVYDSTVNLDAFTRIITEKQVKEGLLSGRDILLIPSVLNLPEDVVKKLGEYVENGGTAVIIPNSLMFDEYNRKKDYLKNLAGVEVKNMILPKVKVVSKVSAVHDNEGGFIWGPNNEAMLSEVKKVKVKSLKKDIFDKEMIFNGQGVVQTLSLSKGVEVIAELEDGNPGIVVYRKGKGKVYTLAVPLEKQSNWEFMDNLFEKYAIPRELRLTDDKGTKIFDAEARVVKQDGYYLAYVTNYAKTESSIKLKVSFPFKSMTNLITGEIYDKPEMKIKGHETVILKIFKSL